MNAQDALHKAALHYLPATYRRLIMHLADTPCCAQEIADFLGMTLGSAYKLIEVLKAQEVICIVEHRRPGLKGAHIKVWGLGSKDVRPPRKRTPAERSKAWRDRKRPKKLGFFHDAVFRQGQQ